MRRARHCIVLGVLAAAACRPAPSGPFLAVWAGDSAGTASDFLGVLDADPASPRYGAIVASLPTGEAGTHPHHTEPVLPANGHLLANGFHAGRTWLFDLSTPRAPRILASFGDLAGFSHPHSFLRLANGHVLATFQYRAGAGAAMPMPMTHAHGGAAGGMPAVEHATGGLVEMAETGAVVRSASAADAAIPDRRIYPYSVVALPAVDRLVSTTTDMDDADTAATSQWVQLWRASDLALLRSVALPPGPRGDENRWTGEPIALPDGRSVLIHTFTCGLYLLRDAGTDAPAASLVWTFEGSLCGVPVLAGRWWVQAVPSAHALVALDVSDPAHPREVSRVTLGDDERPHWLALDPAGRRLVTSTSDAASGNRLFVVDLDPATGRLTLDARFRDAGSDRPGVRLAGRTWPHGFTGTAVPHGTVFTR